MFFNKKIYKGLYKVKMDIYKCPNPKKFLKYILEKREIITFKLFAAYFYFIFEKLLPYTVRYLMFCFSHIFLYFSIFFRIFLLKNS
jgi:hypothetical protein